MDFTESAAKYPGTFYWDFHRAHLHNCLLARAVELGAVIRCNARVEDVVVSPNGNGASVLLSEEKALPGEALRLEADLVVGADGINSRTREIMLGHEDPPTETGDLAYRLLLRTEEMVKDEALRGFVEDPQVNYWLGPDKHAGMFRCLFVVCLLLLRLERC